MYKVAVLGSKDTVLGFKALGLEIFPVETKDAARKVFHQLTKNNNSYAIIYVEETYAKELENEINKIKAQTIPAVILIPGRDGSLGIGMSALNDAVEQAVGMNILEESR